MTKIQAIHYLRSSGMSDEQIAAIAAAFEHKWIPVNGSLDKKAIEVIKENCYVFNPLNFERTTLINKALDRAVAALQFIYENGESIIKYMNYFENDIKATIEAERRLHDES